MMTQYHASLLACILLLSAWAPAWAVPLEKIDSVLLAPAHPDLPRKPTDGNLLPVSVLLAQIPSLDQVSKLESLGFELISLKGKAIRLGRLLTGKISQDKLRLLAELPFVERVEPAFRKVVRKATTDSDVAGIGQAYEYTDDSGLPLNGEGVTVCVDDTLVDIFHPAYFKDDGGTFTWIDVNANGSFDPGTDAVDLNANNTVDVGELLSFFDAPINRVGGGLNNDDGVYQVDLDYLYNDHNGDGVRNFGPAQGFTENDPTYGEQLFYAVDQNGNNALDEGESLVGLATSKVVKAYWLDMGETGYLAPSCENMYVGII